MFPCVISAVVVAASPPSPGFHLSLAFGLLSCLPLSLPSSLSELPEVHLPIGTQPAVVEQLTCISLSPSVRTMSSLLVATVFLCLAATPETHHHISTPLVIGRLIEACSLERDLKRGKDKEIDMLLLRSVFRMWIVYLFVSSGNMFWNVCLHYATVYHNM